MKRRAFLGAVAGSAALAGCSALRRFRTLPTTGAYPQRFYDAANTNRVPAGVPSKEPAVHWTADVLGSNAPTVRHRQVYDGTLVLSQATGNVSHELDTKGGIGQRLVAGENYLFAVTRLGSETLLQAFDPNDGTVRWETGSEIPFRMGPLVLAGGRLFTPVEGPSPETNRIAAFDTETGDILWTGPPGADGVAVRDGTAFVVAGNRGEISALDASDGTVEWRADDAGFFGRPVVSDGRIFVRTVDDGLHALDTDDGRSLWTHPEEEVSGPAVADETAYVVFEKGDGDRLRALDTATGEPRWTERVPSAQSTPTVTDDAVLVGVRTGFDTAGVVAYDRSGGERWRFVRDRGQPASDAISSVRVSRPVVVEGGLFVNVGRTLYALG